MAAKKRSSVLEFERPEVLPVPQVPTIKHIQLRCPTFMVADGYGNSCEQIALALERIGVGVTVGGTSQGGGMNRSGSPSNATEIFERSYNAPQVGEALIWYTQPPGWYRTQRKKTVGFSMFESTSIPDDWIPGLVNVDETWTPSPWCSDVFGKYTRERPYTIPLGVDAVAFHARRRQHGPKLRILHDSTYMGELRKGAQLAVDAFLAAFPGREDVELILNCAQPYGSDAIQVRDATRVHTRIGRRTTLQLSALYGECDALLYPSRGEGFGLIPLQAMATGMPTIFPRSTGMLAYDHLGFTVDVREVPSRVGEGRAGVPTWTFRNGAANWFEPNLEQLIDRLRELDQNYDAMQEIAMRHAEIIAKEWTWERTARAIVARLEA